MQVKHDIGKTISHTQTTITCACVDLHIIRHDSLGFFPNVLKLYYMYTALIPILYIYHMASRVTYQNISPEVTRKPWHVMSPNTKGKGWHYAPGLLCHHEANILIGIYAWKDMWCMLCSIIKQEAHGPHPSREKPFQIKYIIMLIRRRKNPWLLSEKWIVLMNFVKPWVPFT